MKLKLRKIKAKKPPLSRKRQPQIESLPVASTYSYSSRRSEDNLNLGRNDPKNKDRTAKSTLLTWLRRLGLLALLLIVLVVIISLLGLSRTPKVALLDFNSPIKLSNEQKTKYQAYATKLLASSIWNSNKLTLNSSGIDAGMLSKYPEISNASLNVSLFGRQPILYIEPAQPALILVESNGAFAVDTSGRAMFKASTPQALNLGNVPILTDQSNLRAKVQHLVLPTTDIAFIQMVIGQLANKNFRVSSMTLPATSSELDVYLTGQAYYIKFNLENNDPRQQAGTFLATIAHLSSQNITPSKYVDVRVDGRSYYQ